MNINIRNLPDEVNRRLGEIAARAGKHKYEIIREALIEYVEQRNAKQASPQL